MFSMSTCSLSMKVFLISAGVVSLAMGIKLSVPVAANGIPVVWSIVLSWMKPPYLYIIINVIIITIAASSRFHQSQWESPVQSEHLVSVKTPPPSDFVLLSAQQETRTIVEESQAAAGAVVVYESEDGLVELTPVMVNGSKVDVETEEETTVAGTEAEAEDVFLDSTFKYNTLPQEIISVEPRLEYILPVREKPRVSSRCGHRKPIRTSPDGARALRVARQETLESTWKTITEGRQVPITRKLKKSDTWEQHGRHLIPVRDHVPKSETFMDRTSNSDSPHGPASSQILTQPSLSQDELNRRAEEFIKKVNDEMRLQRQESLNQYMDMINRGV